MALRSFREGDKVKAVILTIDTEKRRTSFGLKPSYFDEDDFAANEANEDEEAEAESLGVVDDDDEQAASEGDESEGESDNEDGDLEADVEMPGPSDDEDGEDEEDETMDVDMNVGNVLFNAASTKSGAASSSAPALKLDDGFQWSASLGDNDVDMSSSEDDENDEGQANKKKKRRRKEIEQDLTADLQNKSPESNADFERLLLGSPNSSYLWIQYMSFQLQLSEIDKAREIAKRALKTISFREEQEKLNVWIALLNLENAYGTEESLETTFRDAARHNDSKTIHLRLAAIFDQSEKLEVRNKSFSKPPF